MTKTTRLMLAVLAVCGTSAALAQSSVNLYGRINTTVENQKLGNASATGMVTNSSFIGFKGAEDLGNGLKAGFVLEANFNSDDGAGPLNFKRNSEVNLAGGFGMLRLGSFDPYSYTVTADTISMHNHDTGTSADMLYFGAAGRGNTIAYRTPDIAGFNAEVQYRFGEKAGVNATDSLGNVVTANAWEDKGGFDLGVNYANGPLGLGFGYSQQKRNVLPAGITAGEENEKDSQFALRASYTIGDLTLGAYYQKQKADFASEKAKRDAYRLAAMYTIGASELHANVGRATKVKVGGTKVGDSATQWTLAYNYNLSKRTKVYALYTNLNHVDSATSEPMGFGSLATSNTGGDKFRSIGVGIRHLF